MSRCIPISEQHNVVVESTEFCCQLQCSASWYVAV